MDDVMGDSGDVLTCAPCCALRMKSQSGDRTKSPSRPGGRQSQKRYGVDSSKREGGGCWLQDE